MRLFGIHFEDVFGLRRQHISVVRVIFTQVSEKFVRVELKINRIFKKNNDLQKKLCFQLRIIQKSKPKENKPDKIIIDCNLILPFVFVLLGSNEKEDKKGDVAAGIACHELC